jgi:TRAP-type C4-dicarboxylate transport system permease large subunit
MIGILLLGPFRDLAPLIIICTPSLLPIAGQRHRPGTFRQ